MIDRDTVIREATERLDNIYNVIANTLSKGEGRVSNDDLTKIYSKEIERLNDVIRFDKVITDEELKEHLSSEESFEKLCEEYPTVKIVSDVGSFVLISASKYEEYKQLLNSDQ